MFRASIRHSVTYYVGPACIFIDADRKWKMLVVATRGQYLYSIDGEVAARLSL